MWKRHLLGSLVVAGAVAVGCTYEVKDNNDENDTDPVAQGGEGESCMARSDCESGLACIQQVCTAGVEARKAEGEPCTITGECVEGLSCTEGVCRTTSSSGNGKPAGEACEETEECATGLACVNDVCTGSEPDKPLPGQLGESCRTSSDCAGTLFCVNSTCSVGDYELEPSSKVCVVAECESPVDCCPEPSSNCETYKDYCEADPDSTYCDYYENPAYGCICDEANWSCTDNQCASRDACTDPDDCDFSICHEGACVECVDDEDCPSAEDYKCVSNSCEPRCKTDTACPALHACDDGNCVEVGCTDDRECIALTRNVRARCNQGDCQLPCERDAECNPATAFDYRVCVDGFCTELGCATNEECKILLGDEGQLISDRYRALCVDSE